MLDLLTIILQGSQTPVVERVWGGGSGPMTGKWSDAQNWSENTVPTLTEKATFDATDTTAIEIDADANCKQFNVADGYTGTITVAAGKTLTVDKASGLSVGSNATLTNNGTIVAS